MTKPDRNDRESPEEASRAFDAFGLRPTPGGGNPDDFNKWVRNLHDVYLNVEVAWLASIHVPPSDVEHSLEHLGGSRRQRLARFVARDMWVLWEAWDRRPQYHEAFAEQAPDAVAKLAELETLGRSSGWLKQVRQIRDYMNHRDKRSYLDPGREELPKEAIAWLQQLRQAFSELLLSAMGMPLGPPAAPDDPQPDVPRNSSLREIAEGAVDDLLVGTLMANRAVASGDSDRASEVPGYLGRAFATVACGSSAVWSECLTALIRRSVVAWARLGDAPELRIRVQQMELEGSSGVFLAAVTTEPADERSLPLRERSQLAVQRVTDWFNSHGDLWATLAAAVSATGVLVTVAAILEDEDTDVEELVQKMGADADALVD